MNRNTQAHFANLPSANIGRSKFNRAFTHKTTFNAGDLIPIYVDPDIVPGDTVSMKQSEIIRMMTPLAPVMDNAYADFYWFFVPDRLVWTDFKKFMGENDTAPWTQTNDYQVPQLIIDDENNSTYNAPLHTIQLGSLLEKMGIPLTEWEGKETKTKEIKISSLPTKAYCLIWNEFFRDENLQNPVNINKTSSANNLINTNGSYSNDPDAAVVSHEFKGGLPPLKVCKSHDYFTSCLPGAQKGPTVTLPLSTEKLPVRYMNMMQTEENYDGKQVYINAAPLQNQNSSLTDINSYANKGTWSTGGYIDDDGEIKGPGPAGTLISGGIIQDNYFSLYTDLTAATGATITQLRQAFAIQKFYERDARGGTRYIESVLSHFGVRNPDYRLQRPEYLGGFRHYINMNQVIQSTPTANDSTPLGTTGAYSVTSNKNNDVFTKSFTEHGILMGLICLRTDHTYQQGINRAWFKKKRLDFYSPEFANLSEMAVLNKEIYVQGTSEDEEAFGYQEAWAEMRYMPDMITGEMRNNAPQTLSIWHWGDYYTEKPTLGDKWIKETKNNIQRTLAVQNHDQFEADFYFGAVYTRPMPLYSIPGLIDHH